MKTLAVKRDPASFLEEHFELPPLPAVLQKLLEQLNSSKANAREVADLLAADVSLVAQIMKIVNSAYFGLPHPIRDVRHAVAYLGLSEIKRMALAAFVMDSLAPEESAEFEQFWYHSFHTALAAKLVAKQFSTGIDPEELYVAALLHDVGKLVYLKFFPEQYLELTQYANEHSTTLLGAEEALEHHSHAAFGALLCGRWSLGDTVMQACMTHELRDLKMINRGTLQCTDDIRVICISNALSNLVTRKLPDDYKSEIQAEIMSILDYDADMFLMLTGRVHQLVTEVEQFISDLH